MGNNPTAGGENINNDVILIMESLKFVTVCINVKKGKKMLACGFNQVKSNFETASVLNPE